MNIINNIVNRLRYLTETIPEKIYNMDQDELRSRHAPDEWSKKENLGHLIDSAANNHQRFVAVQYGKIPELELFKQDDWIDIQHYNDEDIKNLVNLWVSYNRHILHIISVISPEKLGTEFKMGDREINLLTIIHDYLKHTEHHLKKIVGEL